MDLFLPRRAQGSRHCASSNVITVQASSNYTANARMLVGEWDFSGSPTSLLTDPFRWINYTAAVPPYTSNEYTWLGDPEVTAGAGIPAQGNPNPLAFFGQHAFASVIVDGQTRWLDPSYGEEYGNAQDSVNAKLAAFKSILGGFAIVSTDGASVILNKTTRIFRLRLSCRELRRIELRHTFKDKGVRVSELLQCAVYIQAILFALGGTCGLRVCAADEIVWGVVIGDQYVILDTRHIYRHSVITPGFAGALWSLDGSDKPATMLVSFPETRSSKRFLPLRWRSFQDGISIYMPRAHWGVPIAPG